MELNPTPQRVALQNFFSEYNRYNYRLYKNRNGFFCDFKELYTLADKSILTVFRYGIQEGLRTDWCRENFFITSIEGHTEELPFHRSF